MIHQHFCCLISVKKSRQFLILCYSVSSPGCSNHQNGLKMALVISGLSVLFGLLALPTANFADIVKSEGKRYCEISIPAANPEEAQINISVYYLFYSSILSYWIPLMVRFFNFFD